jgi:hypothetical protein
MTAPLRPMNLGEILDRTFEIYRKKFLVFAGIAALPALATAAVELTVYVWRGPSTPFGLRLGLGITFNDILVMLGFHHFSLFAQFLLWPSFAFVASGSYIEEQASQSLRSALRAGFEKWRGSLVMSAYLLMRVLVLPEVASAALFIGTAFFLSEVLKFSDATMDAVFTPILILFLVLGWAGIGWMTSVLSPAIPSRMLEGLSVRAALR